MKYRAMYHHCEEFLETMVALKQADYAKYQKKVRFYLKLDLLILDDFLLHTITDEREINLKSREIIPRTGSRHPCIRRTRAAASSSLRDDELCRVADSTR